MKKKWFYLSSVDEGEPPILDEKRRMLWRFIIWFLIYAALFGIGHYCSIE